MRWLLLAVAAGIGLALSRRQDLPSLDIGFDWEGTDDLSDFPTKIQTHLVALSPRFRLIAVRILRRAFTAGLEGFVDSDSSFRTFTRQDELYAQTDPIVTDARGGESPHNYREALDFYLARGSTIIHRIDDGPEYALFREIVESEGAVWGGRWGDGPHFEHPAWRELKVVA